MRHSIGEKLGRVFVASAMAISFYGGTTRAAEKSHPAAFQAAPPIFQSGQNPVLPKNVCRHGDKREAWKIGFEQASSGNQFKDAIRIGTPPETRVMEPEKKACLEFRGGQKKENESLECCMAGFRDGYGQLKESIHQMAKYPSDRDTPLQKSCVHEFEAGQKMASISCEAIGSKGCPALHKTTSDHMGCFSLGFHEAMKSCSKTALDRERVKNEKNMGAAFDRSRAPAANSPEDGETQPKPKAGTAYIPDDGLI